MDLRFFLISLIKGTTTIDSSFKKLVDNLFELGILTNKSGIYKLNSRFTIGKVYSYNDKLILKDINIDGQSYDINENNEVNVFDIAIGKRIFSRTGVSSVDIVYTIEDSKKLLTYVNGDKELIEFKSGFVLKENMKKYKYGDILIYKDKNLVFAGNINDYKVDEIISLQRYGRVEKFGENVINEVKNIDLNIDFKNRVDLTKLDFVTIDPADAKDFDDALYYDIRENALYIAIADVSTYVKAGSSIDYEALSRGFSIYFPNKSIPMLPRELSEGLCSLNPDVNRYAFVIRAVLDNDYNVKSSKIFEAVIKSSKRLTYEEADGVIAKTISINKNIDEWLQKLSSITKVIKKSRMSNGFDFKTNEVKLVLNKNEEIVDVIDKEGLNSSFLVEECMLIANKIAAEFTNNSIFRVHLEPDLFKLENLFSNLVMLKFDFKSSTNVKELIKGIQKEASGSDYEKDINDLLVKAQMKAFYSHHNNGHFGLGFNNYSHFTSPIRRYSDLLLHRIIKAKINKCEAYKESDLDYICTNCSALEIETNDIMIDYNRRKYARTALKNIGVSFNAKVSSLSPVVVSIVDGVLKGASVICDDSYDLTLFNNLVVKIISVNLFKATINVEII